MSRRDTTHDNKKAAQRLVEAFAEYWQPLDSTQTRAVVNDAQGRYQVVNSGAIDDRFVEICLMEMTVKPDGAIHVVTNNTEWEIDEELIAAGVAPEDIAIDWKTEVSTA